MADQKKPNKEDQSTYQKQNQDGQNAPSPSGPSRQNIPQNDKFKKNVGGSRPNQNDDAGQSANP